MQVYFLENEDVFGDLNNLLYKAKNGRFLNDNDKRFATYCLAAIKMLPNLFWYPNVIICSGWTSALIPMLVKILAKDDKDLAKIKTVYIASSLNEDIIFNPEHLGFNEGTFSPLKSLNLNQIGCLYADKTIIVNGAEKVSPKLKKLKVSTNNVLKKVLPYTQLKKVKKQLLKLTKQIMAFYVMSFLEFSYSKLL